MNERRREDVASVVFGLIIFGAIMIFTFVSLSRQTVRGGGVLVSTFDRPTSVFQRQLVRGDGQAYAAIAADPGLERFSVFRGGRTEAAYRAQRPLYPYAAWLGSFGRRGWVDAALVAVNGLAAAATALVMSRLARLQGGAWWLGPLVLLLPGSFVVLNWSTSEVLALALTGAALWAWLAIPEAVVLPSVLFALAVLTRETVIVAPAGLGWSLLVRGRYREEWRRLVGLLLTPVPWLLWVVFLRLRIGAWSFSSRSGRLGAPLVGLVSAVPHWDAGDWVDACVLILLVGACLRHYRDDLRWVVLFQFVLAAVMGKLVWGRSQDFTRVLLPLYAFSLIGLRTRARAPEALAGPAVGRS